MKGLFNQSDPNPKVKEFIRISHGANEQFNIIDLFFLSEQKGDSRYLMTVGKDGIGRKWLWKPEDLIKDACERISGNLNEVERKKIEEEWKNYAGEDNPFPQSCFSN